MLEGNLKKEKDVLSFGEKTINSTNLYIYDLITDNFHFDDKSCLQDILVFIPKELNLTPHLETIQMEPFIAPDNIILLFGSGM